MTIEFRNQICEVGYRLWARGLVAAHDGNISVRINQNHVICTPSGVSKGFMSPSDLITINLDGEKIVGLREPTSERRMHLEIYKRRPDITAVVHAHPPHGTAYAVQGVGLPEGVMPEIDVLLGKTPVVPYFQPGTKEFADAVGQAVAEDANVLFLERHGVTTIGKNLEEAWFRMESLDHCCKILMLQAATWHQNNDNVKSPEAF